MGPAGPAYAGPNPIIGAYTGPSYMGPAGPAYAGPNPIIGPIGEPASTGQQPTGQQAAMPQEPYMPQAPVVPIERGSKSMLSDISIDGLFNSFIHVFDRIDAFWHKFAFETPGIGRMIYGITTPTVKLPFGTSIPSTSMRTIVNFLCALLDIFRVLLLTPSLFMPKLPFPLSLATNFFMPARVITLIFTALRIGVTLILMIEELITGQWRQFLATSLGLFSASGVLLGFFAKIVINVWLLIEPSYRTALVKDIFKSGKSILVSFLLWITATFAPSSYQKPLQDALQQTKVHVQQIKEKLKALEDRGSAVVATQGLKLKLRFKGFDLEQMSQMNISDIQNLKTLAQWKELVCSDEFHQIMEPLKKSGSFVLALQLLGIPTTPSSMEETCGSTRGPFLQILEEATIPEYVSEDGTVVPAPPLAQLFAAPTVQQPAPVVQQPQQPQQPQPQQPAPTVQPQPQPQPLVQAGGTRKRKSRKQKK